MERERYNEIKKALAQIARFPISLSRTQPSIAEKYNSVLPEIQNPKEKIQYMLTHDISDIRQEYEAILASNPEPHKKKKKQKVAERKR